MREPESLTFGRIEELRRLERCERGLAEAYRRALPGPLDAERLKLEAARSLERAALLRARIEALGGDGANATDDDWLQRGRGEARLRTAEATAILTYHDHLTDFDGETRELVRGRILPEHERALGALETEV